MKIDGKNAITGTLVISPGQRGEVDLPWGSYELVFNPLASPLNVSLISSDQKILFDGTDNPLGLATNISVPIVGRPNMTLTIAVYTIGENTNATRIVHYTVS